MTRINCYPLLAILLICSISATGQKIKLEVDVTHSIAEIQPTMYGIFFEDINFAADGGVYAEMIKNRGFEFDNPKMGWQQPNSNSYGFNKKSGIASSFQKQSHTHCH